jgi:acyl carrier protein
MTRDEILAGVKECVSQALDVPVAEIREEHRLIGDLGGDSLDLLDLTFHLERRFSVKISPRDIEKRGRAKLGGTPWEVDGVLSSAALAELRSSMPEVPPEELKEGLTVDGVPRVFRVATMVNVVSRLLEEQTPRG